MKPRCCCSPVIIVLSSYIVHTLFVCVQAARARGVDYVVAPYEADAQLAYLNKTGIVQAIITEDSDLLAFGCKKVMKTINSSYISRYIFKALYKLIVHTHL